MTLFEDLQSKVIAAQCRMDIQIRVQTIGWENYHNHSYIRVPNVVKLDISVSQM